MILARKRAKDDEIQRYKRCTMTGKKEGERPEGESQRNQICKRVRKTSLRSTIYA